MLILLSAALLLAGCATGEYRVPEPRPKTVFTVLFGQSNSDPGLEDMLSDKIYEEFADIELEWESVDWGEYFSAEMQAKLAAGEVPDMMIGKAQDVPAYEPSGYLAAFGEELYGGIREDALESVTVGGEVYGLPYNVFVQGVLYNKNIFWRYGLEPPSTLAEMEAVIARLGEVNVTPFATHFRENWFIGNVAMQFAVNQVFLRDPTWGDEFRSHYRSFKGSAEYAACYAQVKTLFDNTWPDALTVDQNECGKRFASQEAAMYVTGTWSVQKINTIRPDLELGIFPFPNEHGDAKLLFEPNLTFMKNSRSSNGELADSILKAILEDRELAETTCAFTQTTSALKGVDANSMSQIEDDIAVFAENNRVIDVTVGNRQLVWAFQDSVAERARDWLEGNIALEDVLSFADDNRTESGNAA
jgi:ABC-type glycerol-3-phosphate transport system substrate-binding protein